MQLSASNDSVQSWGGGVDLSGRYTFTAGDNGQKTFSPTFLFAGSQTVTATDTANPTRNATTGAVTVTSAPATPLFQSGDAEPAGVALSDGSILWAYLSSQGRLYARRNVGTLAEPAWRSLVTVREPVSGGIGAASPSLALVGSTLALFHTYTDGTYQQVWLTTSTDNGATWSTPVKLTSETAHVQRVQALTVGSTLSLFWSKHDTSGQVRYQTTTNLTSWTSVQTLSQAIGASVSNTTSNFGITKLAAGTWVLGWVGASAVGEAPNAPAGSLAYPVVKVATSADLTSWSAAQELTLAYSQRGVRSVALGQDQGGTVRALFEQYAAPSDTYIAQRTSTTGTSWAAQTLVGYDRSAPADGQQNYHAAMPALVAGTTTCGWSAEVWTPSGGVWPPSGTGLQSYGHGSWTEPTAGEGVSLLDCGTPAEVLPIPYGEMPQTATGTLHTGEGTGGGVDLSVPALAGGLTVARAYRSFDGITGKDGPFGYGWHWSYGTRAMEHADGSVTIIDAGGRRLLFTKDGAEWTAGPAINAALTAGGGGGWVLTTHGQSVATFDSSGKLTAIADRNGNTHTLTYSGSNVSSIAAPGGRTLTVTTSGGRITRIDGPGGLYSAYTYDGNGNLLTARDAAGSVTTYAYDDRHQLTSVTDPRGTVAVGTTYGTLGRVTEMGYDQVCTPPIPPFFPGGCTNQGGTVTLAYPPQGYAGNWGGMLIVTDPRSNQQRIANDAAWRTLQADAYEGSTTPLARTTFVYNANGDVTSATDANGRASSATYDGRGNILTATADVGGLNIQASFTYNNTNDVLTATNGLNETVTFTYDGNSNVLTATNPLSQTTAFTYNGAGQMLTATNPTGQVTTNTYDTAGFPTSTTARGVTADFVYDTTGRLTESSITPSGQPKLTLATATYDGMGRVLTQANGLNHMTTFTYDANGNRLTARDPLNHTTTFAYDAMNRLETVTDARTPAGVTTYSHDLSGNLTGGTDANGQSWTTTYDALNRPASSTDPLTHSASLVYDAAGNVLRHTTPNGVQITTSYDGLYRPTRMQGPFGSVEYAYDAASRRTRMTDSTGTTQYVYDAAGRPTSISAPVTGTVQYGYDASGRRTSLTYPSGRVVTYAYASGANGGNLTGVSTTAPSVSATYTYDPYGRLEQATTGAGYYSTYGCYDGASRLTDIQHKETGGTVFQKAQYVLDAAGNRTQFTDSTGTITYSYDAVNQLLSEVPSGTFPTITGYTYDKVGNRLTKTVNGVVTSYTYDDANRMTAAGSTSYTYDNNGNQTSRTTGSGTTSYNWDALNRLTSIAGGSSYTYNGDGLRVKSTSGSTTTTFAWDLSQGTPQLLSDGNDYVYGPTGLLAVIPTGGSCAVYAFSDGLGSIQAKREAGGSAVTQRYDAFGTPLAAPSNPCTAVRLGFAGEQEDTDSGLVYLRARYMDPSTGRFLGKDPMPGGNGYSYASNNPVRNIDPSGKLDYNSDYTGVGNLLDTPQPYEVGCSPGAMDCYVTVGKTTVHQDRVIALAVVDSLTGLVYRDGDSARLTIANRATGESVDVALTTSGDVALTTSISAGGCPSNAHCYTEGGTTIVATEGGGLTGREQALIQQFCSDKVTASYHGGCSNPEVARAVVTCVLSGRCHEDPPDPASLCGPGGSRCDNPLTLGTVMCGLGIASGVSGVIGLGGGAAVATGRVVASILSIGSGGVTTVVTCFGQ